MRVLHQKLTMLEGCEVEVSYKENASVWYKAIIVSTPTPSTNPRSRARERSLRLLKDDFSTPLWTLTRKASFRPVQPKRDYPLGIGSIVGADHEGGWWTGTLVKEIDNNECLVLFGSLSDIIQFQRKHLRPHLEWVKQEWQLGAANRDSQFLRKLKEEPMFSPGALVEVSCEINVTELVWRPAVIVRETYEYHEKKYIVKVCDTPLSYKGLRETVYSRRLRPRPPPFWVEEYRSGDCVEVFHGTEWRQGRVKRPSRGFLSADWCTVILDATKEELHFKHSDLRPLRVWKDNVWKSVESPLTQRSRNNKDDSATNAEDSGPAVTPSPIITATLLNQTLAETQGNVTPRSNENSEDNNRKRKREDTTRVAIVDDKKAIDTTVVLPFKKKLPIWETFESMSVFKTFPQSPHFKPLVGSSDNSREVIAVGLMLTFSGLLEEVKNVQLDDPISSLVTFNDSFAELGKHGFDIKLPQQRIKKLLSLRDKKAKKMEELKDAERVTSEKERLKVENERKIIELQRLNKEVDKEIAQSKSCAATVVQQLEDVELQFQRTSSAPW